MLETNRARGKSLIHHPTKITLTADGIHEFLRRKVKTQRFILGDGTDKWGIVLKNYHPPTLQKMILQQYVSIIEMTVEEFVASRKELLDLSKLIAFAMLYLQFDINIWETICNSEIVKNWNRSHPKYPIDHKTEGNPSLMKQFLKERVGEIEELKKILIQNTLGELGSKTSPIDMESLPYLIEKFLSSIRPFSWVLLTTQSNTSAHIALLQELRKVLLTSITQSYICEYIALLILELVSFLKSIPEKKSKGKDEPSSKGISILWQIRNRRNIPGDQVKLSVIICDQQTADWEIGAKISSRVNTEVNKTTLKEFYNYKSDSKEAFSLGLSYLSFLKNACNELGITFKAFVTTGIKGSNYINLIFLF